MPDALALSPSSLEPDADTLVFYRHVLEVLGASGVPSLVGGGYAFACYTGIERYTKDLDLFLRPEDCDRALDAVRRAGYDTELTHPHWLAKVRSGESYVDLIFSSGNGLSPVDEDWFRHAARAQVLGMDVRIPPAEEMICSKAFIMERERYDGADVTHLLRSRAKQLDWQRLSRRFGPHWRILMSHLVLFGFVYPAERSLIPAPLMHHLLGRLRKEVDTPPPQIALCGGTLLSREQYLHDIEQLGYRDARLIPFGNMTADDAEQWTDAIPERGKPAQSEG